MSQPKYGIVVTTINRGQFLAAYLENLGTYGHLSDTRLYVAADRKTPADCRRASEEARCRGLDVVFLGIDEQLTFLRDFPLLDAVVPWNSDNRRNVGFVMALRDGVETVISIDDDNLPVEGHDFVGGHSVVGREVAATAFEAKSGWYNLFEALDYAPCVPIWPRGFPYRVRRATDVPGEAGRAIVHVNAGLWLGDPDVDAITRLANHPSVQALKLHRGLLGPRTYSPINTQNTAIHRDAMAAYYYVLMGEPIFGSRLNRFGDIWSGYFVQKCCKSLGYAVAFGDPAVAQVRNEHDLFSDLREEYWGIVLSEHLSQWLVDVRLVGATYESCYGCLADELLAFIRRLDHPSVNHEVVAYFEKVNRSMHAWLETIERMRA